MFLPFPTSKFLINIIIPIINRALKPLCLSATRAPMSKHLLEDREASALRNDTKIVIKSSLLVTFSHVHDYVGWLVQCPKSLKKKPTPGQKFFFWCPLARTTPSLFLVFFPIPYPPVLSFYDSVIPCSSEILIFLFFVHLFQMVVGSTMFFILFLHLHIIILGPASFRKATHILLSLQTLDVQLALLLLRILITMLVTSTPPSPPPLFFRSYGTELCSFKHSPYLVCATSLAGCLLPFLFLHRPPTLTSFTHTFSLLLPSNLFS